MDNFTGFIFVLVLVTIGIIILTALIKVTSGEKALSAMDENVANVNAGTARSNEIELRLGELLKQKEDLEALKAGYVAASNTNSVATTDESLNVVNASIDTLMAERQAVNKQLYNDQQVGIETIESLLTVEMAKLAALQNRTMRDTPEVVAVQASVDNLQMQIELLKQSQMVAIERTE